MTLVPLVLVSFWIGIYPKVFFDILDEPVQRLVQQVEGTHQYPEAVTALRPDLAHPDPSYAFVADEAVDRLEQ
jgi:hypothetical protein